MYDMSAESSVCERIIIADLHADIFASLSWETLSTLNEHVSDFVTMQISILHRVVRRTERACGAYRKCKAVDIMQKFRYVDNKVIFTAQCT